MIESMDTWQTARNILCVRLDNLGDVLMTTPAFRALKTLNPGVRLTLLTSHMGAGIARYIPEIDEVLEFDVPWVRLEGRGDHSFEAMVERLRAARYDAAVIFTVFSQNPLPAALLCYLAGIPLRLGYCRESPYDLLTDWVPDTEPFSGIQHEVVRQLKLVETIGAAAPDTRLSLAVAPAHCDQAAAKLRQAGIDLRAPWLLMHPGVSEARRQYPLASYAEAGCQLVRQGYQIVLSGTEAEEALTVELADRIGKGSVSVAGRFSLGEFIGLVVQAPLLIANNTGPVHIAAASGTPTVVLYALTNPQHVPWNVPHRVLYFDIPADMRSQNVLLTHTYQMMTREPIPDARPQDIVQAVQDLLVRSVEP